MRQTRRMTRIPRRRKTARFCLEASILVEKQAYSGALLSRWLDCGQRRRYFLMNSVFRPDARLVRTAATRESSTCTELGNPGAAAWSQ
jgi:hypothetical protein